MLIIHELHTEYKGAANAIEHVYKTYYNTLSN